MNKKLVISSSLLFEGLSPGQVENLAAIAHIKSFQRGETIFFEGDEGIGFYMIDEEFMAKKRNAKSKARNSLI